MNIDPTGLEEIAKPDIEDGGKHYKNAYNMLKSIDLPSGAKTQYKEKISSIFANIKALMSEVIGDVDKYISDLKDANISTEITVENQDFSQNGNIAINNSGDEVEKKNPIEQFFSAGKESFGKFFGMLFGSATQNDVDLGKNISMAAEEVANSTMTEEEIEDFLVGAGGAAVNGGVAVADGIATFFENVVDFLMMTEAYQTRQELENQAIWFDLTGNKGAAEASSKMGDVVIGATTEVVEKDYVEEGLDILYSQDFMQKINEGAYIKRGDSVYMVIEGVSYYIPITISEAVLPGSGTAVSFMAGTGKADAEYLTQMKMNSKEGITSEYEEGNISEETYKFYQNVWKMSDEEYRAICLKKITGEITDEQFEYIENIRNMPEEWATVENANKAMAGAGMIGAWESAQWAVGVKLNKLTNVFGSKMAAPGLRVGIDTGFNTADTGYRALVDTIVLGKEYGEAFEDRGGWVSTGISGAVGLLGSVIGEAIDLTKGNKKTGNKKTDVDAKLEQKSYGVENINDRIDVNKQTDEQVAKIVDWYKDRIGTMVDLSDEKFNVYLQRLMEEVPPQGVNPGNLTEKNKLILETIAGYINEDFKKTGAIVTKDFANHDLMTLFNGKEAASFQDQFFLKSAVADSSENGYVGVKQTMFRDKEAEYIVDSVSKISDKYEITEQEAAFLIKQTHSGGGGCSIGTTAALLTEIANKDSEKFFQKTGIVPFKEQNGKVVVNTEEIYMDAFVFSNTFEDGYITKDATGKMMVDIKQNHTNSPYGYQFQGLDVDKVNAYLESNGLGKLSEKEYIRGSKSKYHTVGLEAEDMKEIAQKVNDAMQKGEMVVIGITPEDGKVVSMLMPDVVKKHGFNRDHMMKVYGANATGLVVDTTWGMRGVVSYVELMENVKDYKIKILKLEK